MQDNKRIWFVTGISKGLGKAIAKAVIAKGDFLVGTFRTATQAAAFNIEYKDKAHAVVLDLTDVQQVTKTVAYVKDTFGTIDVLVNNAGVGFVGAVEEATLEEVRAVFEANVFGTLQLTQAVLPLMRSQQHGHIVQISSHSGVKASAGFGIYNSSKFALEGFSEALAQEVGPLGIKVTLVEPGPFRTDFAGGSLGEAQKVIEDYAETAGAFRSKLKSVHGKQEGDPEKAAKAILDFVDSNSTTLRLPLGKIPIATIGMKIESLTTDLVENKEIAESVVFE